MVAAIFFRSLIKDTDGISLYRLEVLRTRGRPTFRFFTASRSFGSISQTFPTGVAFRRPLAIILRTLLRVPFKRFAAAAVLMIFMTQL
jgi:hypothetical protein